MTENFVDVDLIGVNGNQTEKIGEFIVFFSQVEWIMANAIFYAQISTREYSVIKNIGIIQKYFENILALSFSKKITLIKKDKIIDTRNLLEVNRYRNDIVHGFLGKRGDSLIVINKKREINFSLEGCDKNIKLLKEEATKLLNFIQSRGYKIG